MNTLVICRKRGWKRRSRSHNASAFLSFFAISLVSLLIICSISTAYFSVPVYAIDGWQYLMTVWELITTLTVGAGSAPVSSAVNQAGMASQLGQMTVAELASGDVSIAQCDAAIQALTSSTNAAQQAAGGIAQSFATTASDAVSVGQAISSAGIEGVEIAEGAMSAGENLANSAAASVGAGSIVGMLGCKLAAGAATLGAASVAVVAGVGLGVLGYNIVSRFADYIKKSIPLENGDMATAIPDGSRYVWTYYNYNENGGKRYTHFVIPNDLIPIMHSENQIGFINPTDHTLYYKNRANGSSPSQVKYSDIGSNSNLGSKKVSTYGAYQYGLIDQQGFTLMTPEQIQEILNSEDEYVPTVKSPDLVNPNGNYTYNPTTNNYNYNYNNNPTYNTTNQTLQPIYNTDYEQFIQNTNYNTTNNIDNSQTFQNFIENYLEDVQIPAPDTNPDIPVQPDKPTVPDLTPEQVEQNKEMMLPADLKDYFPFCIPFDIYALFTKFDDIEREAPHLQFDLDLGSAGTYPIDIDFSDFDDLAALLRLLELIGFIMALMVAGRKLIGD